MALSMPDEPNTAPVPLRTGIVVRDALPWHEEREIVETAEDAGYEAVFVPEIDGREAFSTLTGFAGATSGLGLGTGVVTVWARSPVTTAMAASTVQDLSGGRMILGVGAGSPAGIRASAAGGASTPLRLVEEFVRVVREAISGEPVAEGPNGDPFRAGGVVSSLRVEPFPIWIAALGDRMVSLGARVADGILLNWCPPERVVSAKQTVADAAARAGRDPADVTVAVYVRACLGVDDEHALPPLRAMTALYASIPHYRRQLEAVGLGGQAVAAAKAAEAGRPGDVPEDLVRALTILGGRDEALARFDAYRRAGADVILLYPVAALDRFSSILGTILTAAPDPAIEH
jgi:alkanesulfonate monooxygenase SsuD/methylene tetrahydromethanopterin reductase-like flavin-dependent oxidoreductase (luciferase family)